MNNKTIIDNNNLIILLLIARQFAYVYDQISLNCYYCSLSRQLHLSVNANKMAEAAISLSEIQAIDISPVMGKAKKMLKNCIHIVIENIILRKIHSKRLGNGEEMG